MNSFSQFFKSLLSNANISLSRDLTLKETRYIISKINEYLYTNYEGIGYTRILDEDFEYFSDYHKFWEKYHKEILEPKVNENQCEKAAEVLHNIYMQFGKAPFYELYNTFSLSPEEISLIRYFSANQDFRGTRSFEKLFEIYSDDPTIFDEQNIHKHPEDFLKNIGITSLSQNDKRVKYARTAAEILIQRKIEPYDLLNFCDSDLKKVKDLLLGNRGSGFGNKKIDMFLRDMVVLGVWQNARNFDKIDVASDINTVKVALRSRMFQTEIILLSSFLDIFCYQYGLIDKVSALAWRTAWEKWSEKYPNECVESPCLIDYLAYRIIGKDFCRESLYLFECAQEKHTFKWHSPRNSTCQICYKRNIKNRAHIIKRGLPCCDDDGYISIQKSKFVSGKNAILKNIKACPFSDLCNPKSKEFKKLNPPKSISILGQTGWQSANARRDEGGGGLMA